VLGGAAEPPRIGHFYFDVPRARLHCLNDTARALRAAGVPVLAGDAGVAELRDAGGQTVAGNHLPLSVAAREARHAEAHYQLCRSGQPARPLYCSATPLKDADGKLGAILASVVCLPPTPDWPTMAGLAHDLRTPLQTLAMLRQVLEFRTLPEAQRREAVERIGTAAQRAQQIAQELLEWCRTHGARTTGPQPQWFALDGFLREVLAEHAIAAAQKGLGLEVATTAARGWQIHTDPSRLARILANLMVNAIRYTPAGGQVILAAVWDEHQGARSLALEIHDTGVGILPHEQESIFNPFERGQSARGGDSTGSGVGLSVVDRLTQELGLGCDVHSAAGQGSRFRVLVPQQLLRMAPAVAPG
jgi:anti-sigma regulatory factor (Ser/Thr protein kinase)